MPIAHVDKDIVQGILHIIPGECSGLAKPFGRKFDEQRHHLDVCVIELRQIFLNRHRFTPAYPDIVELTPSST